MIIPLDKSISSKLRILHNIPKTFFRKIESHDSFGDHLFPKWSIEVFSKTDLQKKFKAVYDLYKNIPDKEKRDLIIEAFENSNKVELLCANDPDTKMIVLNDVEEILRGPIDELFEYLYNSATKYPEFEKYCGTSVFKTIDSFIEIYKMNVCPICGLESYTNIEGQPRLPLDHWLNRDMFPFASINSRNLVPIGTGCNSTGVKGNKNVLIDDKLNNNRVIAYYPYKKYGGLTYRFNYIEMPSISNEGLWKFEFILNSNEDLQAFKSWDSTFNIYIRYNSYLTKNVINMWESEYKDYIKGHPILEHANSIADFKNNLINWRSAFSVLGRPGSIAYLSFIDYLLNADDNYLTGLYKSFYSEEISLKNITLD